MSDKHLTADVDKILEGLDFARLSAARDEKSRAEKKDLLLRLIEVADSLRALKNHCRELAEAGHDEVPYNSVKLICRQLLAVLEGEDVRPMKAAGHPLDLALHEVVAVRPESDAEEDSVLEEVVFGYLWNDQPLRRAKVIVCAADGVEDLGEVS
ncbi:MAG: nucleotide exchange factor GrpE [bacterium]|nr:nucleotide exchange factor GrpE [bacterium]